MVFFTWIFEFGKVHIFWEGHKNLSYILTVKIKIEISQNFVAFSGYLNFTSLAFACNLVWHDIFNSLGIFEQSIIHRYRLCALVKKKHCHWRIQRKLSRFEIRFLEALSLFQNNTVAIFADLSVLCIKYACMKAHRLKRRFKFPIRRGEK